MDEIQQKELVLALERLERERNIKKEEVFKTIEDALVSALRKHIGKSAQITAKMDPVTGQISATQEMKIVETVVNPETEMSLEKAAKNFPGSAVDSQVSIQIDVTDFSRIAAQIAKQVLIQKIRDIERDSLYRDYKPREGEVITGLVRRFSDKDIVVDLGKAEGVLPYMEQIKKERYAPNSRVKAVILNVISPKELSNPEDTVAQRYRGVIARLDKIQRGPYVILSRAAPLFLTRLFEVEVPEISERLVEIVTVERDAGFRSKVVVKSSDSKVDPIGACVGMRGMRIRPVTNELSGERIDLIAYTSDSLQMIVNAMSPAKVTSVRVTDKEAKKALVVVPDDQLPIAIGKDWQNIRLASKITGWELEVKSESQVQTAGRKIQEAATQDLTGLEGVGQKTAEVLVKAGLTDIAKLAALTPEYLSTLQGVGEKTAKKIIAGAQKYMKEKAEPAAEVSPEVPTEEKKNDDSQTA